MSPAPADSPLGPWGPAGGPGCAVVLNLDAELELASRGAYRATRAMGGLLASLRPLAARALLEPRDVAVDELFERGMRLPPERIGIPGRAWCPTPRALERLLAVGAVPEPAPSLAVLREANSRRFCAELGQELPGARLCEIEGEVLALLADDPARTYLAKRSFSAAGRGRRPLRGESLDPGQRTWIRASLEQGPLQVEPRVEIELEFGTHGSLSPGGGLHLGEPTVQAVDPAGTWRSSRPARAGELAPAEREALLVEAERVGRALLALGYHGPYGVDAYRWRDEAGIPSLCRRSEVNARYSMGWRSGMQRPVTVTG